MFASVEQKIQQVRRDISHTCDGPITNFVLISRAMEHAVLNPAVSLDDVANALFMELEERGMLVEGNVQPSGEY